MRVRLLPKSALRALPSSLAHRALARLSDARDLVCDLRHTKIVPVPKRHSVRFRVPMTGPVMPARQQVAKFEQSREVIAGQGWSLETVDAEAGAGAMLVACRLAKSIRADSGLCR
jgi:hypothetical protein